MTILTRFFLSHLDPVLLLPSRLSHFRLCATSRTAACQAPLSMGFSRPKYWSGLPCPPAEGLPNPGVERRSPALQADSLPSEPPGSIKRHWAVAN